MNFTIDNKYNSSSIYSQFYDIHVVHAFAKSYKNELQMEPSLWLIEIHYRMKAFLMIIGNDKNPERLSFTYSYFTVKVYIYKYRWKKESYFYSNLHVAHHHSHQTKRKKAKT